MIKMTLGGDQLDKTDHFEKLNTDTFSKMNQVLIVKDISMKNNPAQPPKAVDRSTGLGLTVNEKTLEDHHAAMRQSSNAILSANISSVDGTTTHNKLDDLSVNRSS
mmetsp:Transcript_23765/g.36446  ORF Transcript_23765/g.36446 Transcript_23765/m.36446 type:complete len:106 (-) Transcript_23765:337-654(-)